MSPRVRKQLVVLVVLVGVVGIVLAAIATNLIRLGPTGIALPPGAGAIAALWVRFPDLDPLYDYYAVRVTVENAADTPSVYPYAIAVNLTVIGGEILSSHYPFAGDHLQQERVPLDWGGSPPGMTLNLPAGEVRVHDGGSYFLWTALGKRGLASQPIFTTSADFYAEFRIPENATMEAHPDVLLDWYYANALQAYSVATRGANTICYYVPEPGSEGTAGGAPCR